MTAKLASKNWLPGLNALRVPGLDTLRALAIAVVMVFHLQGILPNAFQPIARFGWMGVDLFFVLSGYLIGSHKEVAHLDSLWRPWD